MTVGFGPRLTVDEWREFIADTVRVMRGVPAVDLFHAEPVRVRVPPVELDDRGDPVEDVEPLDFVRYVNFAQRFDAETNPAASDPGSNNPGSGR